MNRSLSADLLLYGVMLFGLSVLAHYLSVDGAATTFWVGITGGTIATLLGVLGLCGYAVRGWAIAAMAILSIVLLVQTVIGWMAVKAGVEAAKSVATILIVLFGFAVGQLVNLLQNRSGFPSSTREQRDSDKSSR